MPLMVGFLSASSALTNSDAAAKLLTQGESPRLESLDANEFAAYTMVASLLLNLDETVTKE